MNHHGSGTFGPQAIKSQHIPKPKSMAYLLVLRGPQPGLYHDLRYIFQLNRVQLLILFPKHKSMLVYSLSAKFSHSTLLSEGPCGSTKHVGESKKSRIGGRDGGVDWVCSVVVSYVMLAIYDVN